MTYDIRMKKPNGGDYLENGAIHTFEHLFATYVRNTEYSDKIVYIGPMGCRTGFYFLTRDTLSHSQVLRLVQDSLRFIASYAGRDPRHPPGGVRQLSGARLGRRQGVRERYAADFGAVGRIPNELRSAKSVVLMETIAAIRVRPFPKIGGRKKYSCRPKEGPYSRLHLLG